MWLSAISTVGDVKEKWGVGCIVGNRGGECHYLGVKI